MMVDIERHSARKSGVRGILLVANICIGLYPMTCFPTRGTSGENRLTNWIVGCLFAAATVFVNSGCGETNSRNIQSTENAFVSVETESAVAAPSLPSSTTAEVEQQSVEQPPVELPTVQHPLETIRPIDPIGFPAIEGAALPNQGQFQQRAVLSGHQSAITCISVTPDSKNALSNDATGQFIYWDLESGSELWRTTIAGDLASRDVSISPDGRVALIVDGRGNLTQCDLQQGGQIGECITPESKLIRVAFTDDPRVAALIDEKSRLVFVDVASMHSFEDAAVQLPRRSSHQSDNAEQMHLQMPRDINSIIVAKDDALSTLTMSQRRDRSSANGRSGQFKLRFGRQRTSRSRSGSKIVDLALNADDTMVAVAYDDGQVDFQPVAKSTAPMHASTAADQLSKIENYGRPTPVRDVAILPGGQILAAYGGGKSLDYWSLSGITVGGRYAGDVKNVSAAKICPDGRHSLSGYNDGRLEYFELPQPRKLDNDRLIALRDQMLTARDSGDFDALERIGNEIRQAKRTTAMGGPEYSWFFSCLTTPSDTSESSWSQLFKQLDAWSEAKPESTLALIALANAHTDYGWEARGGSTVDNVTIGGMAKFKEELTKAGDYLLQAEELDDNDPALHLAVIRAGMGLSMGKELLQQAFEAGLKADPSYWPLYSSMATCLLPRWYGEPGDLAKFFEEIERDVQGNDKLAVYAYTAGALKRLHSSATEMALLGIDLDKVHAGSKILVEREPYANWDLNLACWSACSDSDRDAARDLFGWIGPNCETSIWTSEDKFRRARTWAMSDRSAAEQTSCNLASLGVLTCLKYSPDGKTIAVGGVEGFQQVSLWDATTGKFLKYLPHPDRVLAMDFSPNGKYLVTAGGRDGNPQIIAWNLSNQYEPSPNMFKGPTGTVSHLQFSRDAQHFFAGSNEDEEIWVWSLDKPKAEPKSIEVGERVEAIDVSKDGSLIAVAGPKIASVIEVSTEKRLHSTKLTDKYTSDILLRENDYLVSTRLFGVYACPLTNAAPRAFNASAINDFGAVAKSIEISPDKRWLACALNYWRNKEELVMPSDIVIFSTDSNQEVARFSGHTDRTEALCFSPDGTTLAGVGRDGTLRTWRLPDKISTKVEAISPTGGK